jgi:hypothetical protein
MHPVRLFCWHFMADPTMKLTSPFSGFNGNAARLTLRVLSRPHFQRRATACSLLSSCWNSLSRRTARAANDRAVAGENEHSRLLTG